MNGCLFANVCDCVCVCTLGCVNSGLFAVYSVSVSGVYVCTSSSLPTIFNRFVWISFETMCTDDNLQQICTSFSSSFSFVRCMYSTIYCVRNQNQKTTIGWKIIITIIMKWIQWNVHLLRDNVSNSSERQSSRHTRCMDGKWQRLPAANGNGRQSRPCEPTPLGVLTMPIHTPHNSIYIWYVLCVRVCVCQMEMHSNNGTEDKLEWEMLKFVIA